MIVSFGLDFSTHCRTIQQLQWAKQKGLHTSCTDKSQQSVALSTKICLQGRFKLVFVIVSKDLKIRLEFVFSFNTTTANLEKYSQRFAPPFFILGSQKSYDYQLGLRLIKEVGNYIYESNATWGRIWSKQFGDSISGAQSCSVWISFSPFSWSRLCLVSYACSRFYFTPTLQRIYWEQLDGVRINQYIQFVLFDTINSQKKRHSTESFKLRMLLWLHHRNLKSHGVHLIRASL